jgi:hypothetical protein
MIRHKSCPSLEWAGSLEPYDTGRVAVGRYVQLCAGVWASSSLMPSGSRKNTA